MSWAAWLIETATGRIGPRVPALAGSKAEWLINGTGSWTVVCDGAWLDAVPRRWWYPWASGVLVCHDADDGSGPQPVVAGPATAVPAASMGPDGETGAPVTLSGQDYRALLARRIITGWRDWPAPDSTWELQHEQLALEGMSLGTVAQRLVEKAMDRYAGALPVDVLPALAQDGLGAAGHTRTYYAHNLSNNDCDKLLTDLSNADGGPDIALRPVLRPGGGAGPDTVRVELHHGVEGQPQIPQRGMPVWDAARPHGSVAGLKATTDSSGLYTRSWATGAGQDADILMDVRQNDDLMRAGMPLMEQVRAYQSVTRHETLLEHVDADLAAARTPVVQWQVDVDARAPGTRPGLDWSVGDRVRLLTPPSRAYARLEDGPDLPAPPRPLDLTVTTLSASADLDRDVVTVKMQEDQ